MQWSPIAGGILARPWNESTKRGESDFADILVNRKNEVDKKIVDTVEEIAKARGVPMAAVATAWCLSKPGVNPIVGLNSKERIDQAVEAVKLKLTEEEIKRLEENYQPKAVASLW